MGSHSQDMEGGPGPFARSVPYEADAKVRLLLSHFSLVFDDEYGQSYVDRLLRGRAVRAVRL